MYIITQQPALSKLASALIIIAGKHQSPEMCAGWVTFLLTSIPAIPSPQPKPCMLFKFTEFLIKFKISYSDPSALGIKSKFRANTQDSVPCKPYSIDLSQARLPAWSLAHPCYNLPCGELNQAFPASKQCVQANTVLQGCARQPRGLSPTLCLFFEHKAAENAVLKSSTVWCGPDRRVLSQL